MPEHDPDLVAAARARWRAGLLTAHAQELRDSVDGATPMVGAGLIVQAAEKDAEAKLHETAAALHERYHAARLGSRDGTVTRAEWLAVEAEVAAARLYWRQVREAAGARISFNVDHFEEPSDGELMGVT